MCFPKEQMTKMSGPDTAKRVSVLEAAETLELEKRADFGNDNGA
jgi:hypothetical protein